VIGCGPVFAAPELPHPLVEAGAQAFIPADPVMTGGTDLQRMGFQTDRHDETIPFWGILNSRPRQAKPGESMPQSKSDKAANYVFLTS
jgi:hypothetical protein